jgi:hypothetical protein
MVVVAGLACRVGLYQGLPVVLHLVGMSITQGAVLALHSQAPCQAQLVFLEVVRWLFMVSDIHLDSLTQQDFS